MSDTITRDCKICEREFDSIYGLDNGVCDECQENNKKLNNCIECGEPVEEWEPVTNCHGYCRLEL